MTEGFRRPGEPRPPVSGLSESVATDRTQTADEGVPGQPRQRLGAPPSDTGPRRLIMATQSFRHRPLLLIAAAVLLTMAALVGVRYYHYFITHEWTDDAFIEGHIIQISPKVAG